MSTSPAYRADGRDVVARGFYALASRPARSVVVEACAGAGKTWMLVSRIALAARWRRRRSPPSPSPRRRLARCAIAPTSGREFARARDGRCARQGTGRAWRPERRSAGPARRWANPAARVLDSGRAVEVRTFHARFAQLPRAAPWRTARRDRLTRGRAELLKIADHAARGDSAVWRLVLRDEARRADHAERLVLRHRQPGVQAGSKRPGAGASSWSWPTCRRAARRRRIRRG